MAPTRPSSSLRPSFPLTPTMLSFPRHAPGNFFYCGKIHTMENLTTVLTILSCIGLNHLKLYRSAALRTFILLTDCHQHPSLEVFVSCKTVLQAHWSHRSSLSMTDFLLPLCFCTCESLCLENTTPFSICIGRPGKPHSSSTSLGKPIPSRPLANVVFFLRGHKHQGGPQLLPWHFFPWVGPRSVTTRTTYFL